ncbi:hypothetical protein SAMN05428984_4089 [Sphingomonas sp. OK281]|nr:hypothetical protein SAMN05428984_4089 [Sphingomonas sp. OK281]
MQESQIGTASRHLAGFLRCGGDRAAARPRRIGTPPALLPNDRQAIAQDMVVAPITV